MQLHTNDLSMNDGKLFRKQMIENFKAIEQAIDDIYQRIGELEEKEKQREEDYNAGGGM